MKFYKTKSSIKKWLLQYNIDYFEINDSKDGFIVDIHQSVDLVNKKIEFIPFKIGTVNGHLNLKNNQIKKLDWMPELIYGDFNLSNNLIEQIDLLPQHIDGFLGLSFNKIKQINCFPKFVKSFFCCSNKLTKLPLLPESLIHFDCSYNNLTKLTNSPLYVNGTFNCSNNKLISLIGGPKNVKNDYIASINQLQNLEGIADHIGVWLDLSHNKINSLYFFPKYVFAIDLSDNLLDSVNNCKDVNLLKNIHLKYIQKYNLQEILNNEIMTTDAIEKRNKI